jgi:hypothetical protein
MGVMDEPMHVLPEHCIDCVTEQLRARAIDEHAAAAQVDAVDSFSG